MSGRASEDVCPGIQPNGVGEICAFAHLYFSMAASASCARATTIRRQASTGASERASERTSERAQPLFSLCLSFPVSASVAGSMSILRVAQVGEHLAIQRGPSIASLFEQAAPHAHVDAGRTTPQDHVSYLAGRISARERLQATRLVWHNLQQRRLTTMADHTLRP